MNKLVIALLASIAVSTTALAVEPAKPAAPVAEKAPETKKVCHKKEGKEVCKTIKVHKKAEKVTEGAPTDPVKKDAKKK